MPITVVNGSQYGDEGKGKIVDMLAKHFDLGVRPTAGDNAGHTVVANGKTVKMRLAPSAIVAGTPVIIGDDVMINPVTLAKEINDLKEAGIDVDKLLMVSTNAHIVMPYHVYLDELNEKGSNPVGSTRRGIGPAFADKVSRRSIRMEEFTEPEIFKARLNQTVEHANNTIKAYGGDKVFSAEELFTEFAPVAAAIRPYVGATVQRLHKTLSQGGEVLIEGAQGSLIDLVFGSYPYVTSSRPITSGLLAGAGVGPQQVERVIGVIKPYQTRVGIGPVVGEMFGEEAKTILDRGNEYGTVTGRARRIMACDLVGLNHSVALNGTTVFALTKLDVLDTTPEIKLITGYSIDGKLLDAFPSNLEFPKVEPVYTVIKGWNTETSHIREYDQLPLQARELVKIIEDFTKVAIGIVSVGADRDATIIRHPNLVLPKRALGAATQG